MDHTIKNQRYTLWNSAKSIAEAMVHDYVFNGDHIEDANQEVMLALWEATMTWQEDIHSSFEQYAFYVMRGKLFHYLTQKAEDKPTLSKRERDVMRDIRKSVTRGQLISSSLMFEISKESGISEFRLQQIINYWYTGHIAITASVASEFEEPLQRFDETILDDNQEHNLNCAIKSLSERERVIIIGRFLEDPRKTLAQLSIEFGVSVERIRVIEGKSLKKLRHALKND